MAPLAFRVSIPTIALLNFRASIPIALPCTVSLLGMKIILILSNKIYNLICILYNIDYRLTISELGHSQNIHTDMSS